MEEQIITITVKSRGETCEMTDAELRAWYEQKVAEFFDPKLGMPEITVEVERILSARNADRYRRIGSDRKR